MEQILKSAKTFLFSSVTANITSFPYFCTESVLVAIVCLSYILLHIEFTNIQMKTIRLQPNRLHFGNKRKHVRSEESLFSSFSVRKICSTSLRRMQSSTDLSSTKSTIKPIQSPETVPESIGMRKLSRKIDDYMTLTPEHYVKIDKLLNMQNTKTPYGKSLSNLYTDLVEKKYSEESLKRLVKDTKEQLEQAKVSEVFRYVSGNSSDGLTRSLFNLLEKIVLSSSLKNPLSFKGEFTTLSFDVGRVTMAKSDELQQTLVKQNQ